MVIHYCEGGNFAQRLEKSYDLELKDVDENSIVAKIEDAETDQQLESERVYESIKGFVFKRIRRVLPVTGSRFDWESLKLIQ